MAWRLSQGPGVGRLTITIMIPRAVSVDILIPLDQRTKFNHFQNSIEHLLY